MSTTTPILTCLSLSFSMQAQDKKTDSISIIKELDAMFASWNKHDYSDLESYISKDCE